MQNEKVETQLENGIATITFFHPQGNSLPGTILKKLLQNEKNNFYKTTF